MITQRQIYDTERQK